MVQGRLVVPFCSSGLLSMGIAIRLLTSTTFLLGSVDFYERFATSWAELCPLAFAVQEDWHSASSQCSLHLEQMSELDWIGAKQQFDRLDCIISCGNNLVCSFGSSFGSSNGCSASKVWPQAQHIREKSGSPAISLSQTQVHSWYSLHFSQYFTSIFAIFC